MNNTVLVGLSLILLSACNPKVTTDTSGGGAIVNNTQSSSNYTYSYNVNGCETGEHSFGSASDYCNGLKNEQLNKGCAKEARDAAFDRDCR